MLLLSFLYFVFGFEGLIGVLSLNNMIKNTKERIAQLQEQKISFEEEKKMLETDPRYAEKIIREKYGFKKEGEIILEFSGPKDD